MEAFVARVVHRLRQEPGFSRNRYFVTFSSPEGKRALRIHRHLRSIETDLSRGCSATVEPVADRVRLVLRARGSVRTAWLSADEYRILRTSAVVRAALADAGEVGLHAGARPDTRTSSARRAPTGSAPR